MTHVAILLGDPRLPYAYGPDGHIDPEELNAVEALRGATERLRPRGYRFTFHDDHSRMFRELEADPPDLALNFCDNGFRNILNLELHVPATLELMGIPYTGASPFCMCVCSDKALVRQLAASLGVPVPDEILVDVSAEEPTLPERYPALIKPNSADGSVGIHADCVVHSPDEARRYMRRLAGELRRPLVVVQEFLTGDEYTVGVVGNPATGFQVFPPLVVDYSALSSELPPILDYGSKVDPDSPYWQALRFRPAELEEDTLERIRGAVTTLFSRLDFRDYGRFDFRAGSDGVPRLIDANFNPTWFEDGKLSMMAGYAGLDYTGLIERLISTALARHGVGTAQ